MVGGMPFSILQINFLSKVIIKENGEMIKRRERVVSWTGTIITAIFIINIVGGKIKNFVSLPRIMK